MDSCTCGQGEDAPAVAHSDSCPCVDWVSGELEGDSPFEYVFPIDQLEDDRGKNLNQYNTTEPPQFRDFYNEEDDVHDERE